MGRLKKKKIMRKASKHFRDDAEMLDFENMYKDEKGELHIPAKYIEVDGTPEFMEEMSEIFGRDSGL